MLLPGDWPKLAAASVDEAPFWPGQAIHAVYARVAPICEKDQRRQPFPLPGIGFPIRGHHPDVTPLPSKVWMACPGSWRSPPSLTGVCTWWERQPRSSRQDTRDCKTAYMCSRWCPLHWHPQRSAAHTRHTHCLRGAWWACPTRCRTGREEGRKRQKRRENQPKWDDTSEAWGLLERTWYGRWRIPSWRISHCQSSSSLWGRWGLDQRWAGKSDQTEPEDWSVKARRQAGRRVQGCWQGMTSAKPLCGHTVVPSDG